MVHMYIPNIVSINLANNFITNINTLAKMNLWKVSNLDMTKNLIKEVPKLHFVNTKGKSVKITMYLGLVINKLPWLLYNMKLLVISLFAGFLLVALHNLIRWIRHNIDL